MSSKSLGHKFLVTLSLILLWAIAVIAVVFAEAFWFASPAVDRGDIASIENHLVQKLHEATVKKNLGCAALVLIQDGKIAAEHVFGVANAETQTGVNPDQTLFRIASVSKAVTAWGVMKLVEEGRLSLDEPILPHLKRWRFPGSEIYRDKVTVRQLLSHTAGLDDGLGYGGFLPGEAPQTLEESLTLTRDSTVSEPRGVMVTREPGKSMVYGSAAYTILQLLIEEVTNRPFAEYMKETIFQPLGMSKSSFDLDAIIAEGRQQEVATSYDHQLQPQPQRRHTSKAGVGLFTTPLDLARFALAYTRENAVLKQETLKQMMIPQPGTAGTWGLGQTLFVANDTDGYVVGHDGGSPPAWGAMLRVNPATGNGFVLMISGGRGATNQLGHDWVYWETGKLTFEARRQVAQDRVVPASVAMIIGTIAIVLWKSRRSRK
jgi:CubicO group peptidase (beta-lactamase class C family)